MTEDRINKDVFIRHGMETYDDIHDWIRMRCVKKNQCEECGTTKAKRYQWANINHEYRMNEWEWKEMCVKCHSNHDVKRLGKGKSKKYTKWGEQYYECVICFKTDHEHIMNGKCEKCFLLAKKFNIQSTGLLAKNEIAFRLEKQKIKNKMMKQAGMENKFKIEKGVEIPDIKMERKTKYPFRKMDTGDSFVFSSYSTQNLRKATNTANAFSRKNPTYKFVCRKKDDTVRIFRIS